VAAPQTSLLEPLAAEPLAAAVLLDVDGVLAPIVDVPADAAVPEETRAELRRLHGRYGLVACVSGRPARDAERVVGVPELVYVGEHGLELAPEAAQWRDRLHAFAATVDWDDVEPKPLSVTLHYRRAANEDEALRLLQAVASRAQAEGLVPTEGKTVLELRPPVDAHKDDAAVALAGRLGALVAGASLLFAGDDVTDEDAFRALRARAPHSVTVRVVDPSGEGHPHTAAEFTVVGTEAMRELLERIAEIRGARRGAEGLRG